MPVVIAFTLAACSSSGSAGGGTSSTPSGDTNTGGSSPKASSILVGSAIPISSSVYSQADAKAGLTGAVDAVNAAGGVNGHPLKVDFCDTKYTVNGELACARKLVSDKVAVVLNPYFLADQTGAEYKLFAQAGIPVFGTQGISPAELNNDDVYPLSGGLPGWAYGEVDQLLRSGATKISILTDSNPVGQFVTALCQAALKSAGVTPVASVVADPSADPTFATAAGKATSGGTNGVILVPSPVNIPKAVAALKQSGYKGKIGTLSVLFPQALITALGAASNGVLVDSQAAFTSDSSIPAITAFKADMAKYGQNTVTDASLFMWSAVNVFVKAIAKATSFDGAGLTSAIKSVTTPISVGTVGPWQASGVTSPLSTYTRILNPTMNYGVVDSGKIVQDGRAFIDPFTSLAAYKTSH